MEAWPRSSRARHRRAEAVPSSVGDTDHRSGGYHRIASASFWRALMTIRNPLGVLARMALALYACGGSSTKGTTGTGGSSGSAGTRGGGGTTSGGGGTTSGGGGTRSGAGGTTSGGGGTTSGGGGTT